MRKEVILAELDRIEEEYVYDLDSATMLNEIRDFINNQPEQNKEEVRADGIKYVESITGKEFNSISEEQCNILYAFEGGYRYALGERLN